MNWLARLAEVQPVAHALLVLALTAVAGLALGGVSYRRLKLGSAGVLFAGIAFGHFGVRIDEPIREFVKEFGLILFVFTIGLQLGPGFVASMRRQGLKLNLLAVGVVLGGALLTAVAAWAFGVNPFAALGLFSGATTNTPSLGAGQQAVATLPGIAADLRALPALAYAVSYPVGIVGIIGSLIVLRLLFRVDLAKEVAEFEQEQRRGVAPLERRSLVVVNPNLDGVTVAELPGRRELGIVLSRLQHSGETEVRAVTGRTVIQLGDRIVAVATRDRLDRFQSIVGRASEADLTQTPGAVSLRRVVVTRKDVLGKTLEELGLDHLFGVVVSRVTRADLEMSAVPDLQLQFGDVLNLVGEDAALVRAAAAVGNSMKALNETQFVPLFVGIALGVIAGLLPVAVPGLPVPVRLGLAGGPLLLAILLSRVGHFGRLVWHMPENANLAFRELGIVLFLACVGLKAGQNFFATVFTPTGLAWVGVAVLITMVPLLVVGIIGRFALRLNFMTLSGLIAGSMTDPPALAFAGSLSKSDAPHVAYATVYPLTMLLRIVAAQVLALVLCG